MEQFLNYYSFSDFIKDQSTLFDSISYSWIKEDLYILIERTEDVYNIHFVSYPIRDNIGKKKPDALNTLIENFKLDNNDHRKLIQQYLDYN